MRGKQAQTSFILLLLGVATVAVLLLGAMVFKTADGVAADGAEALRRRARGVLQKLSSVMTDPLSRNDVNAINGEIERMNSEATQKGDPLDFGIGILNKEGMTIAGRYIVGEFRRDDFSSYRFFKESSRKKKRVQERIYFQDGSQLLVLSSPVVVKKKVIGAIVLGFEPTGVNQKYGVTPEQFLNIDFNK